MVPLPDAPGPRARARCEDPAHTPTPELLPPDFWKDTDDHLIDAAWGLIANAWDACAREGRTDWHDAAIAWRDRYHSWITRQREEPAAHDQRQPEHRRPA